MYFKKEVEELMEAVGGLDRILNRYFKAIQRVQNDLEETEFREEVSVDLNEHNFQLSWATHKGEWKILYKDSTSKDAYPLLNAECDVQAKAARHVRLLIKEMAKRVREKSERLNALGTEDELL
jgi:hypothetical protein